MSDMVLIHPPLSQQERYGIKFKAGGQTPPTGLAMIAAVLREQKWDVRIIDAPALGLSVADTVAQTLALNPKIVGLTAVSISIYNARSVAQGLKAAAPKIPIVLGGSHLTAVPEETLRRFPEFDLGVIGEGELTAVELVRALLAGQEDLSGIAGLILRRNGELVRTAPRPFIENLDSLPFPAWDLLPDLARCYCPPVHTLRRFPAALLVPSRGCPGQCIFCDKRVFGSTLRAHSADYIMRMLRHLKDTYGIREVQFRDDNLPAFRKVLRELCQRMIDEKIDLTWSCAGRVDMVNAEILALMKQAGCWQIWYGIESGSDRVLQVLNKHTNVEKINQAVRLTAAAGIAPCGFFMIGNPTETEADIQATIKLLLDLPLAEFHISHLTPLPGSQLYAHASEYGEFDDAWEKMSGWTTTFVPSTITREKLIYYSNLAFKKFYFRPRIVLAYLGKLRSWYHVKAFFLAFLGFLQFVTKKHR